MHFKSAENPIFGLKIKNKAQIGLYLDFTVVDVYLYPPRVSVNMKFIEELSGEELGQLWNAVVRNVDKIEITDKDFELLDDYVYGIDRVIPAVYRALDEMDVTIDNILNYDDEEYDDVYDKFYNSFVETALLAFINNVEYSVI